MLNTGVASFSPAAPMAFPLRLVNTTSRRQTVTLTNNGTTPLSIRAAEVIGEFQISNTCGSSVPVGANCTISAAFQPTSAGNLTGSIILKDSASPKPHEPGGICKAEVMFAPTKTGNRGADLGFTPHNSPSPPSVALLGTGSGRWALG
jgi:hypothetical protein